MSTTQATLNNYKQGGARAGTLRRWALPAAIFAVVVVAAAYALVFRNSASGKAVSESPLYEVKSGPLSIIVPASGSIRNSDATVLRNEVEGQTTVLTVIEEGKDVKKGELLIELDSSEMKDKQVDQEIKVETERASFVKAKESLEITKKQGEADVKSAEVKLELAMLDIEKYTGISVLALLGIDASQPKPAPAAIAEKLGTIDWAKLDLKNAVEGEYQQELLEAKSVVTTAEGELEKAKTKYNGSVQLQAKGYLSDTELNADKLDMERKDRDLTVARSKLDVLDKFTKRRKLAELMNEVDEMAFAVKKAQHAAKSNVVDAEAQEKSKSLTYEREQEKLAKFKDQIAKCRIVAPHDGMVVFATSSEGAFGRNEPLAAGVTVRERQDLFRIPMASGKMTADVKIHESTVEKIREGLPVVITTDALPNRKFRGTVKKIAMVPDANDRWLNPNAKVYNTEITVDSEDSDLRPGMSCTTEIIVDHYDQTAFVPVQAVMRVEGKTTVYLPGDGGEPVARPVEVGLDNNRMIRVISGLKDGEWVLLNPPLPPASKADAEQTVNASNIPPVPPKPEKPAAPPQTPKPGPESAAPAAGAPNGKPPEGLARGAGGFQLPASLPGVDQQVYEKFKAMTQEEKQAFMQTEEGKKIMAAFRSQFQGAGGGRGPGGGGPRPPGGEGRPAGEAPRN